MNTAPYQNPHHESSAFGLQRGYDDIRRLMASAHATVEQPSPPSLREILTAYRTKGDGDREMLLAMLNAKTAEDQRLSSIASLHRAMLEIYQQSSPILEPNHSCFPPSNGGYNYPPASYVAYPQVEDKKASHHSHRPSSRSRSPSAINTRSIQSQNDSSRHAAERPSKRHRSSPSPHSTRRGVYESSHTSEQYPLSPYSSSERSDMAESSPRSKSSMTIGNLLSTSRPSREGTSRDRG